MEHLFALITLVLMLVLLLTACGGKRTLTPTPTPTLPYVEDLQAALLTTSDLPVGWIAQPGSTSNELSTLSCDRALNLPDVHLVTASESFETADGAHLSEAIAAFHPGEAEAWLTALKDGPQCGGVDQGEQDGTPVVGLVMQPAYPPMGEPSYSLRVTTRGPVATYFTDLLYVRIGDFMIQLGDTVVGRPNPAQMTRFAQQAILDFQGARLAP
jgi:hypothetical protein